MVQSGGARGCDEYRRWKGWDVEQFGSCSASDAAGFRAELHEVTRGASPGLRVLELGFGNGAFARWVIDSGWKYLGTEADAELVHRARRSGIAALSAREARGNFAGHGPFDVIVAWDVLEHLPIDELPEVLAECRAVMAPGGAMLIRMPAAESPFSRGIQHGDSTHVQAMTSHRIRRVFPAAGFSSCTTRSTRLPLRGVPPSACLRRMFVRSVDAAVHPVVRLLMRDREAVLTPNMIAVAKA